MPATSSGLSVFFGSRSVFTKKVRKQGGQAILRVFEKTLSSSDERLHRFVGVVSLTRDVRMLEHKAWTSEYCRDILRSPEQYVLRIDKTSCLGEHLSWAPFDRSLQEEIQDRADQRIRGLEDQRIRGSAD